MRRRPRIQLKGNRQALDNATFRKASGAYTLAEGRQGLGSIRSQLGDPVLIAMLLSGLVLLLACANLANLLLAKTSERRHEIAVRRSLGASRGRLISQLLVESLVMLVMSSLDQGNQGVMGIETSFHEAMHQWDDEIQKAMTAEARKEGLPVPKLLSHALIFYTAGEAIRAIAPEHVPYAEVNGLWRQSGLGAFTLALDEVWKPYLTGRGTREEALAELLKRVQG